MNMSDLEGVKTKVCSKCKIEKPVEGFVKNSLRKDGLQVLCKNCQQGYRKDNFDKIKEYNKEYYKINYDVIKKKLKYNSNNIRERRKEYRKSNSDKIKVYSKEYRKANQDKQNAIGAKRKAKKLQATPPWLTKEHLSAIRMCYTESKALETATGIKHHVDHIVPLQGKNVCGLHVPWNLQVLTATENCSKNNHYPDEWEDT